MGTCYIDVLLRWSVGMFSLYIDKVHTWESNTFVGELAMLPLPNRRIHAQAFGISWDFLRFIL